LTIIALVGDCTTTTTLALAGAFPASDDVLVVEADRTGGSVAAWFDWPVSPSLSTVVASLRSNGDDTAITSANIDGLVRRSRSGVRFLPAPTRSIEASQAIDEAERTVFPTIARSATALVDTGRRTAAEGTSTTLRIAEAIIVCHRQEYASAGAAGVRLERTAELIELLAGSATRIIVAVIGDEPFDRTEIHEYLSAAAEPATIVTRLLAADDLSAAALAGRQGVSAKRFARLPLIRSCHGLAESIGGETNAGAAAP